MGQQYSLQLRSGNIMTKIMLKQEDEVIQHLQESKFDISRPINQVGDTILHYAAYNSMKKLMEFLLNNEADPHYLNSVHILHNKRGLSPIDVALPEIREWLIRKSSKFTAPRRETAFIQKKNSDPMTQSNILVKHFEQK